MFLTKFAKMPLVLLAAIIAVVVFLVMRKKKVVRAAKNAVATLKAPVSDVAKPAPANVGGALENTLNSVESGAETFGQSLESYYEKIKQAL